MPQASRSMRSKPPPAKRRVVTETSFLESEALFTWLPPAIAGAIVLIIYFLGNFDVIDTPPALAIDAFLLAGIVLFFPMRYARRLDRRGRLMALGFCLAWLGIVYFPIYRRVFPGERIATVDAGPKTVPVTLDVAGRGKRLDMVIDGHLEPAASGSSRVAEYFVTVEAAGLEPQTFSGDFRETWQRQRQGRRGSVEVLNERKATRVLVENPSNQDVQVTAVSVKGQAADYLTLSFYAHILPPWWLSLPVALVLLAGAVVYDRHTGAGDTASSMVITTAAALTGAFAFPSIGSPHPTFRELIGAVIVAALVGGPIGGLTAWLFGRRAEAESPKSRARAR
jgi:hypothetical protein